MILIDSRIGSVDLVEPLRKLGLNAELTTLQFGDVAFEGRGVGDTVLDIGIELKTIQDLVTSLRSGRLGGHQLPGLLGPKGVYDRAWLVIEGDWRISPSGIIEVLKQRRHHKPEWVPIPGAMSASEMEKMVHTLEICGGLHVRHTRDRRGTVHFIASLFRWFSDKSLDAHSSHLVAHTPHGFLPLSDFRATVTPRFPGVGLRTSLAVEKQFEGSLKRAVNASVDTWANIPIVDKKGKTRRFGLKNAEAVVRFVEGDQS